MTSFIFFPELVTAPIALKDRVFRISPVSTYESNRNVTTPPGWDAKALVSWPGSWQLARTH